MPVKSELRFYGISCQEVERHARDEQHPRVKVRTTNEGDALKHFVRAGWVRTTLGWHCPDCSKVASE
jgi:hypothetical protein